MKHIEFLIKRYLDYCQFNKGLSQKTVKAYRIDLTQFAKHCTGSQWVERSVINDYIAELQKRYKVRSTKRKLATVKDFLTTWNTRKLLKVTRLLSCVSD